MKYIIVLAAVGSMLVCLSVGYWYGIRKGEQAENMSRSFEEEVAALQEIRRKQSKAIRKLSLDVQKFQQKELAENTIRFLHECPWEWSVEANGRILKNYKQKISILLPERYVTRECILTVRGIEQGIAFRSDDLDYRLQAFLVEGVNKILGRIHPAPNEQYSRQTKNI